MTLQWIEEVPRGRLCVLPRPKGGDYLEEEIRAWSQAGVNLVASLLEPEETSRFELVREAELCMTHGIQFLSYPIPDHDVPRSKMATFSFALELSRALSQDKSVVIHCFAGLGRSVMMGGCVLALGGMPPDVAFERIATARGVPFVPEMEAQREWVEEFYEHLNRTRRPGPR